MGFEPTTAGATIQSSAELSYGHHDLMYRQYSGGMGNCQAFFGSSDSHDVHCKASRAYGIIEAASSS